MEQAKKGNLVNTIIDGISGIFLPIINLLSAAGIFKGILAILSGTGVLSTGNETYLVLNAMGNSLFYFLPVLLAATAAKKFGANTFTAMVIAGVLLYPSLTAVLEAGTTVYFLGSPLRSVTYHSSVIPMILAAGLLYFVEKLLQKALPEIVRGFLTPLLSILIVGAITLFAFGPVGAVVGDASAAGLTVRWPAYPVRRQWRLLSPAWRLCRCSTARAFQCTLSAAGLALSRPLS